MSLNNKLINFIYGRSPPARQMISIASSVGVISSAGAAATRTACSLSLVYSADMKSSYSSSSVSLSPVVMNHFNYSIRRSRRISCEITVGSDSETSSSATAVSAATAASLSEEETDEGAAARIGARVRVKGPLKVYHVPKVPEMELTGMEGVLKEYVRLWKGKELSANFPYKVEFVTHIEGRPPVKFFAHLKEDEFEYI